MKKLEDLKTDILNDKIENFYIFFGEDVGIRKHYVDKISTYFDQKVSTEDWNEVKSLLTTNNLFIMKQLFLVYNDIEFSELSQNDVQKFIDRINKDYTCIFIYDSDKFDTTNLFKNFEDYCTEFQAVQPNIAKEFVDSELNGITEDDKDDLAFNCNNLYSNILLEADKIKQYQQYTGISQQSSYDTLKLKNQLLYKDVEFSSREFMNSVLQNDYNGLAYWCEVATNPSNQEIIVRNIMFIFNDFLIAGLCKKYGKFDGSSRAFNYKLPWGRAKEIREFNLIYDYRYYFDCAYMTAEIDRLVKSGKLEKNKIIDYFLTKVI